MNTETSVIDLDSLKETLSHLAPAQFHAMIDHIRSGLTDMEPEFKPIYEACKAYTMTSDARMYAMYNATRHIAANSVPGAIVECGVWRGGSAMVSMLALQQMNVTDREFYLYDTFTGLPPPTEPDVDLWGNQASDIWASYQNDGVDTLANCSLEECEKNVNRTNYPKAQIRYVKGLVEETISAINLSPTVASVSIIVPEKIALLRLDTDWYTSIAHVLNALYERVSTGGIIIIDDYGHFAGARKAVNEFLSSRQIKALLNRIDYTGRLFIKP